MVNRTPRDRPEKEVPREISARELDALKLERTAFLDKIKALEKDKAQLSKQVKAGEAQIKKLVNEKQELGKRVDELQKAKVEVNFEDVASVLRSTLQSLQREVTPPGEPGEMGYVVDKFEVEMKSGLDLREGMRLVQPTATELKPESLSTVRISFKAKPKLKIAEE